MNKIESAAITPTKNVQTIPTSILYTGKILQFFSTRLATKFAIKLFGTPLRHKTPEREKMMSESAQKELVHIPELKKDVLVYTYGYSKRKVLLVHGWSGRGTQLYKIADKLLENGFMTISFDAPAHGKSPGNSTMMTEFIASSKYLEEKFGPFEIAIGHSLGGMVVLNSVKRFLTVKKAIIIGSGDIISDIIKEFVKKLDFSYKLVKNMKQLFLKKFGEDIDNYSASIAAVDVKIPLLVIHDTEDKEVPVECAYNIRKNLIFGEILITNGLGHTRILKDNIVIARILDFIHKDN